MKPFQYIMKSIFLLPLIFLSLFAQSQNSFKAMVKDSSDNTSLAGVTVTIQTTEIKKAASKSNGFIQINNIAAGNYTVSFSAVGFVEKQIKISIPDTTIYSIFLEPIKELLADVVVVSSTRSNERIETATTKTEVLAPEEVAEEATIKPANIASILGDVSGVQIQQSSATSGNANVRIQGLDGRYTQILRDGMPLYGGYAGGFGILSVAPLDLKQIELIKGSSSTLYGGGAIGGLVNLISKKPSFNPDAIFLVNTSTLKENNINAYYAQRNKKVGFTFFGGQTFQQIVDVNGDGFSDVSKNNTTMIHPTLFLYPSEKTNLSFGWGATFDKRIGGDIKAVKNGVDATNRYFEKNILNRNIFTLLGETKLTTSTSVFVKTSLSILKRDETTDNSFFSGKQSNYYVELSMAHKKNTHTFIAGVNITGDEFKPITAVAVGSFNNLTAGMFLQDTRKIFNSTKVETGVRLDHHNSSGNFVLPRIAIFQKINSNWGARAGFGMGYITPNPLTPQIIDYNIFNIKPIAANVFAEKSYAFNAEVNYKKQFSNESNIFINTAFFSTTIDHPIVGEADNNANVFFTNKAKPLVTKGIDTYVQLKLEDLQIYLGYTYTDAQRKYLTKDNFVLVTPKHRLATVISYEIEGKLRAGIEASYTGAQHRYEDYSNTPSYLFIAGMVEKKFGPKWGVVVNCENILNVKQSNYESLYTGSIANPSFKALWAPIDGRVINLSIRFSPFAK